MEIILLLSVILNLLFGFVLSYRHLNLIETKPSIAPSSEKEVECKNSDGDYRISVSDIITGDTIRFNPLYKNFKDEVRTGLCISNDKETKTILIKYKCVTLTEEVFSYSCGAFNNFHLLNKESLSKRVIRDKKIDNILK